MHLILFLLFGLVVGVVARMIVPGRQPGGWIMSIGIGIAGSFLGGFLGGLLGMYGDGQAAGFVMSVVGAVVLLFSYHALSGRRAPV
jgi:uncharacterized membrane protein YeaQ/YmgE (transglycosylase-associated protein family)